MLTLTAACSLLACRDPRTARKRLAALGVPVVTLGGRLLVEEAEVRRALRAAARPLDGSTASAVAGVRLAPGARLWDPRAEVEVGPRRANGRPRGSRERELQAASEAYGTPSASLASSSTSRSNRQEER